MSEPTKYEFVPDDTPNPEDDTRNVTNNYKGRSVAAIAADMAERAFPVHIAIENYQHDYNIGTIVRNANAFNVAGVHIVGNKRWNRRGAMSTEKYVQVYHHANVESFVVWADGQQLQIIGIDNIPGSVPLQGALLPKHTVLVFGQEGPGLSDAMQAACKTIVAIEQYGSTRSVNVGVASGIIMHEWVRRNIQDN